jgi:hypothetical protein
MLGWVKRLLGNQPQQAAPGSRRAEPVKAAPVKIPPSHVCGQCGEPLPEVYKRFSVGGAGWGHRSTCNKLYCPGCAKKTTGPIVMHLCPQCEKGMMSSHPSDF